MLNYICRKHRRYGMGRKYFKAEQIIKHLREAEILLGKGDNVAQVCKKIGVSEQTFYRWRREYGGMQVEQAKKYRELEKENSRLKKIVADLSLDNSILKEVARGNF
jgi:transposase-like protein